MLSDYRLPHPGTIVVTGDMVITEHLEEWWWRDGEHAEVRFCSVMEVRDGKVDRWWDYVDLNSIFSVAPQWWTDHIAAGYQERSGRFPGCTTPNIALLRRLTIRRLAKCRRARSTNRSVRP